MICIYAKFVDEFQLFDNFYAIVVKKDSQGNTMHGTVDKLFMEQQILGSTKIIYAVQKVHSTTVSYSRQAGC